LLSKEKHGLDTKIINDNCKMCPKCRLIIEKYEGCNQITCKESYGGCGYEFCWICLSEFQNHFNCDMKKSKI